jgi:hypothetical protein
MLEAMLDAMLEAMLDAMLEAMLDAMLEAMLCYAMLLDGSHRSLRVIPIASFVTAVVHKT